MSGAGNWVQRIPSPSAYWLNRVLYDVHHDAGQLASYRTDAAAYLSAVPLDDALRTAIRTNDIGAMYLAGANPYLLRAHCLGLHIPEPAFLASLRAVGAKESAHG